MLIMTIVAISLTIASIIHLKSNTRYDASVDLFVNYQTDNDASSSNSIDMSLKLIETYKTILKSERLIDRVLEKSDKSYSRKYLSDHISIHSANESQIITIVARTNDRRGAANLANGYAQAFQQEIDQLMGMESVTILTEATENSGVREVSLPYYLLYVIAAIIGFLVAISIILIQEFYSNILNTPKKIEHHLKLPNLGIVPFIRKVQNHNRLGQESEEEFRYIRTKLRNQIQKKNIQSILVTSSSQGDGRSIISANLACSLAKDGIQTLYVDADLRNPIGRRIFDMANQKGITSVIDGDFTVDEVIQKTNRENLAFISSGPIPLNPTEILSSSKMNQIVEQLKTNFDVIIIDSPPLIVADAASLSNSVDGCLFVVDGRRTKVQLALRHLNNIQKVDLPVIGTILNKSSKRRTIIAE